MTLLYIMVIWTVVCGFVSLGMDWGHVQLTKTQLQRAADAAARAACSGLATDVATAQTMAVQYGGLNSADGTSVVIDPNNDIDFGTWTPATRTFAVLSGAARSTANAVRVTARRTTARGNPVSLTFGRTFGMNTCNVNGIAMAWTTANRHALFVVGNTTLNAGDQAAYDRLASLNYTVTTRSDSGSVTGDATGKDLVVISESVLDSNVNTKFKSVAVPVVVYEGWSYNWMKMTGPTSGTDYDDSTPFSKVVIQNAAHPLAAGLSGTVVIYGDMASEVNWGAPTASAAKVATLPGYPARWSIFGYTAGASMYGGFAAPARRVGLVLRQPSTTHVNANGWKLFDCAVKWAVGDI